MDKMIDAISGTPWWVYVLLIYLVKTGIESLKPRVVSLNKLFLFPILLLFLFQKTLVSTYGATISSIGLFFVFYGVGMLSGCFLVKNQSLQFDKEHGLIKLPGSALTLIMILVIFSVRYAFGYILATTKGIETNYIFKVCYIGCSGTFSGLFAGRFVGYRIKREKSPHVDLKTPKEKSSS